MPKKDDFSGDILWEYGNWNVASDYSRLKIMKPLNLADEYETIATFGYLEFFDEVASDKNLDVLKIRGFRRLIKVLILVINNSKFAIKGKHKKELKEYREELERFYKIISKLNKYTRDDRTKTRDLIIIPDK